MARVTRKRGGATEVAAGGSEFDQVVKKAQKDYGDTIITLGSEVGQPDRISTGVFILDLATLGGIPVNRISHVVGERSAGKSMLSDFVIAGAQAMFPDQKAVKLDIEGTHDPVFSQKLGVDLDNLYVAQPETGEQAIDLADAFVRTKEVSIVVLDSIAALTPMKEIESSAEDALVGLQSQMVGRMIRKVTTGMISERRRGHYVTLLLINQFRMKIGTMWGDPRTVPGGKALEFAATLQFIIKNKEEMGKDEYDVDVVVENEHAFQIQKNKMNAGIRTGEFRVRRIPEPSIGLSEGQVNDAETMLAYARRFGAYTGAGSSWDLAFWDQSHHFRGVKEAVAFLYQNPEVKWALRNFLLHEHASHLGMPDWFLERFTP